jgi:hypothetical protein
VKASFFGGNRRLLFRSYLLFVAGLLAVAFSLQLAYDALLSADATRTDPWLQSTLNVVAAELAAAAPADRERVAANLSGTLGMNIQLLQRDEIATTTDVELEALVNDEGETFYLYAPPSLDELVYVGPVPVTEERWTDSQGHQSHDERCAALRGRLPNAVAYRRCNDRADDTGAESRRHVVTAQRPDSEPEGTDRGAIA